jgi:hypothetical protein
MWKIKSYSVSAISEMVKVGNNLIDVLLQRKANKDKDVLILVFTRKVTRLIEALCLLVRKDYTEESQILARALLEAKFAFDYVMQNKKEYDKIFQKFIDSLMLDKLKQIKATNYEICPGKETREFYSKIEAEIDSRYAHEEIVNLRRYGFTEMSIKNLADATGNSKLYDLGYRFYSRNTHLTDGNEHLMQFIRSDQSISNYENSRFKMILEVTFVCAQSVLKGVNNWLGEPIKLSEKGF